MESLNEAELKELRKRKIKKLSIIIFAVAALVTIFTLIIIYSMSFCTGV